MADNPAPKRTEESLTEENQRALQGLVSDTFEDSHFKCDPGNTAGCGPTFCGAISCCQHPASNIALTACSVFVCVCRGGGGGGPAPKNWGVAPDGCLVRHLIDVL